MAKRRHPRKTVQTYWPAGQPRAHLERLQGRAPKGRHRYVYGPTRGEHGELKLSKRKKARLRKYAARRTHYGYESSKQEERKRRGSHEMSTALARGEQHRAGRRHKHGPRPGRRCPVCGV